MHVVIFEGPRWTDLAPLSLMRPTFALTSGTTTLLHKQLHRLRPSRLTLWVRPELASFCRAHLLPKLTLPAAINVPLDNEPALLLRGSALVTAPMPEPQSPFAVDDAQGLVIAYARKPGLSPLDSLLVTTEWQRLRDLPAMAIACVRAAHYPWDLIAWNEEMIRSDAVELLAARHGVAAGPYHVVNAEQVWVEEQVKLGPGCVLDASAGPILIARGAAIGANAVLIGPCFIGAASQVSPLATIRPGTSIGAMCKVGGEVGNSIIAGYSNKAHDGYLGDSYLGEWVNFGAGTTTSNLKNTYGQVSIRVGKRELDSGRQFLGSVVGDHVKTAIGTRLMTGTYVGCCSMIATGALPPRFVPSFTFLTDRGAEPYKSDKAREVITTVFARRHRQWTEGDAELLTYAQEAARIVEA